MSTKEKEFEGIEGIEGIEEIDLEKGPEFLPLQRINTGEFNELDKMDKIKQSREKWDKKLSEAEKNENIETFFEKGPPERRKAEEQVREKMEREEMLEQDPSELREQYFETEMEPWGHDEMGGRRRKTHRKRHPKRKTLRKRGKTLRKRGKTNRKYKKGAYKRSMKKYMKKSRK